MQSFLEKAREIIAKNQDVIAVFEELDRTGKFKKRTYKIRTAFTIDEELFNEFRSHCKGKGINMSGRIESYIKNELKILNQNNMVKKEIRVIGIDDSPFNKFKDEKTLVVGVVMRGGSWVDGILSTKVAVDGNDATKKLIEMINKCKFKPQLQCIFLDGIAVAGFNVIDVKELNKKTKLPVIIIIRKRPDIQKIKKTLIKINKKQKIKLIEKAGNVIQVDDIFVQLTGIDLERARKILKIVCTRSLIPEPLRLAHLTASGVTVGESKGRA